MATTEELRPSNRPADAGFAWLRATSTLAAIAATLLVGCSGAEETPRVEFLEDALGAPTRTAPLQQTLPTGERFRIRDRALVAEADFGSLALEPLGLARGAEWTRSEHGVSRRTPFGRRTLVLDGTKAEEFLTIERRQGVRTWRWQLGTKLEPSLRVDGRVALVDRRSGGTFEIAPVQILDASGDDVTPAGLRWQVSGHTLELTFDDRELDLPYVIDPAITVITPNGVHTTTTTASLSLAKPTGALVSGSTILVAHLSKRNADAVAATGWTSIGQSCSGTTVCTALLWKKFAGEAGPYAFNWTNATGAAGGIVALANVWQPGSRSPVDSFVGASGTSATANPGSLTNLFTALGEMVVGGFAGQNATPGIPTGKSDAGTAGITTGAPGNRIGVRTATLNETSATVSDWSSTLTSAAWSAQIAGFIPRATDGSGTLTTPTTNVAASSTGNTIAFTYTPDAGLDNGSVSVQVPAGWTAPQTGAGNGQITVSGGTGTNNVTITGSGPWTVRVDNVQIGDDGAGGVETLTITYNSGTASATTGAQTWQAQSRGIATGTMTNLAASPSITVRAPNGSGAMSSSVSNVANGATSQTATFTYTAATGGMSSGAVTVDVPAGWTAPNTTAGTPGYTTASTGTVSTAGQKITVTGVTLAAAATMTITYGSGAGGGATATATAGPATWQVQQRSITGGTLANLASSPSINVYDANTVGSISQTAGPTNVARGAAIGSAITWTFTADAGGMSGGSLGITVPAGWSAPRTTAGAGFTAASTGTLGVSGQQIQVTGLTLAAGATMTVTYGSGGGANLPITGTTSGANTFSVVKHSTAGIASAVATTSQPGTINVYAADGSGTIVVGPISAVAGSTGNTLTFTYTAAAGGVAAGVVELTVPSGWTAPQTGSSTSAGYTTASGGSGTNAIAWNGGARKLTISDVTLAASATLTIAYGANAGSGGGATAPTSTGVGTWTTQQKSTSGGTLTAVGTSPDVTITPGSLSDFLVEASGGGAIGTQTAGSSFTIRITARDLFGNTVTSFNGAGNTVDITSTGTLSTGGGTTGTFANGVLASHGVTVTSSGSRTITATRTSGGSQSGTSSSFTVNPAAAASLDVAAPAAATAGAPFSVVVTARDTYSNIATGYLGTVAFSGGGTGAQLPANYTFVPGDAGTKTFTGVELRQAGSRTITVTDTVTGSITGNDTVTVGHGAATQIALSGSTADLTSGATRVLTATIQDAAGNTVTSDNSTVVTFAKQAGAGTVAGTGTATASSGVASKTITGALAGPVTIEATATGLSTGTLAAFTVVHGAATQIALTGSTTDLASGATRVLTATIQDAAGNTVTSDNSTVVAFTKQSGAGSVSGTGAATASSGVATKTITGALAGSVTLEATATGLTTGTLGAFTVVHGAAAQIALTGSTTDLTSGANRALTATIQDAAGNTVTSDSSTVVAFTKVSGAGTVTGTGNATASSGVAAKTITGQLVGSVAMEATATGLAAGTLAAFTVVHGAAAQIALSGSTADLAAGSSRALTATLLDAAGNTVTSDNSTVVAFAQAAGSGTVGGAGGATAAGGIATKTITGSLAGSVTMEATSAGLTTGTLGAFTVVAGPAAQVELTGSTANLTSGATRVLTATIKDAGGNVVTADNSTVVTFAQQSGAGTVSGTGNATVSSGVATRTVTGVLAGPVTIAATATGLTDGTLGFAVVHGAAAEVVLAGSTASLTSGATRMLTATIRDAAGNTVTSDNSTVVAFAQAAGAGTVSGSGNATASAGVATKTITGQLVGSVTMEAGATGLTTGTLGAFTVVHGAAAQIQLTGSTANLTSGATRLLTATVRDAAGNTVTADNSTVVAFAQAAGAGTVSGSGAATASAGVAAKTITGALAGPVTMEATATGLTTGTLGAFTVVHGAATQIALTGSTANLTSGAARVLTATIQDAAGNTVTSDSSTVVAFAQAAGTGTVTGSGPATASAGVATKTVTGALAGPVTLEATATGLTTGTLGAFTVVHGAATQIAFTHSGSNASGDNHTLTATIQDAAGNTVTADNATVVTFAKTGGAGTVTGLGNATASSGIATKVVANAASGQVDLDAQAAGLATGTASYTIAPGNASTLTSTIAASPTSIVANGSSTSAITVRLKDAAGNDLTGSGGTVALGLTGAGSLSAVTDNGDGTYSAALTSPTAAGSATVTGTLNAAALAATASVTYTHGPAAQITLAESGSNVAGNAHTLTATIRDANGNTVTSDSSTVVAFAKTGGAGTVSGLGGATASSGVATKVVTNMLAGQVDLDAQASGLTAGTASYTVVTGPVSAAASDSTVTAAPATVYANGTDTATITVTLRDAGGNGIAGKTVTLAQGPGSSTISGGGSTNASGVVTFSVSDSTVETVTYTATDTTDSIALADDATVGFTFSDSTPPTNTITLAGATRAWLTGTTLYYNGATGGSFALSSAVDDGGSGPASAAYPAVAQAGWTHGAETVSTPAGGPYVSSTYSFAAGSTGSFSHVVTASDAWAPPNTSQTTLTLTEDSTAPVPSVLCNGAACSAGWYTSSPVSITLAAPDAGAGLDQIRYTTDGSDPTILTGTVYAGAFTVAVEGVTTVKYRAFDRIGNDTGVQSQTLRIDTVVPDTAIDSAPAAATQDTTPTFAFSSGESGSTFQARVDGGGWTAETSPLTLGPLAEGTYTFEVRAVDVAGNTDATPAGFTFTVDTTPANTTITSAPPAAAGSTNASFSFTASDAGPGFECRLDGGAFADCSSPQSYTGLSEAAHTFEVRAEDAAGNLDPTPATHAWTVDLTAPDTSFLSTPASPSANPTPAFGLGSTESPSTFECNLDAGGWSPCSTPFTTPPLGDGSHTLKARGTDAAGNTDATEVTFTWLVDATAPTGSVTAPANGTDVGGTVVLASNSADTGGSGVATVVFQRSPASVGGWTSQAASWDTTAQADGDYDVRVVTTDNAGNSFTSAAITVTVDNTDPSLAVVAPNPVNLATADPATVTATASDDASGVANVRFDQCAEDSPACLSDSWVLLGVDTGAPYAASWPIPSDGPRLLRVRATDNAGRQKTELVLVTIDRIRPAGSLTAPAAGANLRGAAVALAATASDTAPGSVNTVTFQRSPAGAGVWTDVAGDASAPYAGTLDTTALADGLYDLRVFTTDAAGNAEAAPATIQVRVDNTLPTGSVTAPSTGANVRGTIALTSDSADTGGSGVATVQFQRSPAGAGSWTNQGASFDTTAVADGLYDLRVTTTDNAGNAFTAAPITIRVDNTLPTGSVTAPANGAEVGMAPVALTSDSADSGGSGVATVVFERSPAGAGTWSATPSSWNTASGPAAVGDGSYDLRVTTTDNAGNVFTSAAITVLVDHTAPNTSASLAPGSPSNAPVTVSFSANDGTGSGVNVISYRVDGGSLQQGAAAVIPAPGDGSNDGAHVVEFFATDDAGNVEAPKTVTVVIDTTAPSGSGGDPGDYLRGIANLSYATRAADVSSVQFQFSPAGAGAWSNVGAADISPPYEAAWNTTLVADGQYDLRAVVTDTTGNVANTLLPGLPKTVDNTAPSGSVTAPVAAAYVSGSIAVDVSASDGAVPPASGVSAVRFEVKPSGAGAFGVFGTQTAPVVGSTYRQTLATASLADGPADLRVVVTDVAGNETTSATRTVNVDNVAPVVTLDDPGAAVGASVNLTASSSADTAGVTFRYRPVGDPGAGTAIASDATAPFGVTWTTAPAAEQQWELIAVATDGGGNVTTSAPRVVVVDRTQPTGSVTAPAAGATVGGSAVGLGASAADTAGSGVALVEWEVKELGASSFTIVAGDATAPYAGSWNSTVALDGAAEIRAVITDAAGNARTTPVVAVTVDSTGPSVTLTDPGAVLSGPVALAATTGGGAARVEFSISPADAGTWTQIADDATAPFGAPFDTAALADGLYDLRAVGYDGLGNPSAPSLREDVRLDNTAPKLVSATPADGSVSSSANEIVLTASEPVTAPGAQLDGAAAPAPAISGNELTFATGALADGLHVLSGELEDASGTRVPFRVAVTVESSVGPDRPPVERSAQPGGASTLVAPGSLAAVTMPAAAWPSRPGPADFMVLRVDLAPPAPVLGMGLLPSTQLVEVTARWALAGTPVTTFPAPIEILIPNPSGEPTLPATSQDGTTWRTLPRLPSASLPAGQQDGWYRDSAGVHILTRHLTWYALARDGEAPTEPRDLAGVVADDGLTLRWIPGTEASGQLGNVLLYVNGESYREFGPTEFEAKLGAFAAGDTRSFTLAQKDAAGNVSRQTPPLRAVPALAGKSLAEAAAALGAAGFSLGTVRETTATTAPPGTVVEPAGLRLELASSTIDVVVAAGIVAPQTRLAFAVAGSKRIELKQRTAVAVRIKVTKPAEVSATLRDAKQRRLHAWKLQVKAGANVVKLRLPAKVRRPGAYSLTWVARSGTETISRTIRLTLVGPGARTKARRPEVELVLVGKLPAGEALAPGQQGVPRRVSSPADADQAFDTLAASAREVSVVVVDADAFGTRFVADLGAVFPRVRVIAIAREPARRAQAIRAGAVLALPRTTGAKRLAKAIALAAGS